MLTLTEEQKQNETLARQINIAARMNPQSPYAGKYVGIVGGQVVAVMDTLDKVVETLAKIEPNPDRGLIIEANADYDKIEYICFLKEVQTWHRKQDYHVPLVRGKGSIPWYLLNRSIVRYVNTN